eukprot:CAMPEP_0183338664 /NCGR_PEP_ID=MMETSP0164_2-20130417/5880_1 /TAXON_ID=221442 /ORGANISM="Coccolithus pelagicus ssp braarudi, Strain PLY182g" /LENGTH=55 /DNA_ID=CAMNT_0025508547 /DNA_START=640 /DNA_END=804 /DNA_ORIENTATION=+
MAGSDESNRWLGGDLARRFLADNEGDRVGDLRLSRPGEREARTDASTIENWRGEP